MLKNSTFTAQATDALIFVFVVLLNSESKKMDEISFSTSYTFRSAAIANFAKKTRYDPKQVKGEAEALEALESIKSLPQTLIQNAQLHLKELSVLKHLPRGNGNYRTLYNYYKVNGMKYYIEYYDGVDEEGRKGGWMRIDIQEQ